MVHAELSQTKHAAERKPNSARNTQEESYNSAIVSVCSGDSKMAVAWLHLFATMSCLYKPRLRKLITVILHSQQLRGAATKL